MSKLHEMLLEAATAVPCTWRNLPSFPHKQKAPVNQRTCIRQQNVENHTGLTNARTAHFAPELVREHGSSANKAFPFHLQLFITLLFAANLAEKFSHRACKMHTSNTGANNKYQPEGLKEQKTHTPAGSFSTPTGAKLEICSTLIALPEKTRICCWALNWFLMSFSAYINP